MERRTQYLLAALSSGLGIGILVYRFAVLGLAWRGSAQWVLPAMATALFVVGAKLPVQREGVVPPVFARIGCALVGAAIAMGTLYILLPSLGRTQLVRRQLPGFSVELPPGAAFKEAIAYPVGEVMYRGVGGTNAVTGISWEMASATEEDLVTAMTALSSTIGGGGAINRQSTPGPDGAPVLVLVSDTDKGMPIRMAQLACGARMIHVIAIGETGMTDVHARIVRSIQCTPIAAQEQVTPGAVRLALSLPGWFASDKGGLYVTLTDGTSALVLREVPSSTSPIGNQLPALLTGMGIAGTPQAPVGDRVPFVGTMVADKSAVAGWIRRVRCPGHDVVLLALAETTPLADAVYNASAGAGCLRDDEAAPVWPDAPATP